MHGFGRGLMAAAVAVAVAAGTANAATPDPHAVLAEFGKVVSDNGVDEAKAVEIGGIKQWITVRGRDRRNPILLVIHGGPASPELPNRYLFEAPWTDYFTVVEWDQRGSGKTFELNDPAVVGPTIHIDRMVQDAEEMVAYLRTTYSKPKIFVMGHSWGTVLGMSLAERKPQWLYAYIGAGQIIKMTEGEKVSYAWTLDQAKKAGDQKAVKALEAIAPYPDNGALPIEKIGVERIWMNHFGGLTHNRSSYDYWENAERISPDYGEADFKAIDKGSELSFPRLLPELAKVDFTGITRLDCPVIFFAGRWDNATPSAPVKAWFDKVKAPGKRYVSFENSAHMYFGEEPGKVFLHLVQDARPYAEKAGDAAPVN